MSDTLPNAMIWLTGITPIALDVLSGFKPVILTFDEAVADPVGLLDTDVDNMLNEVHRLKPLSSGVRNEYAVLSCLGQGKY